MLRFDAIYRCEHENMTGGWGLLYKCQDCPYAYRLTLADGEPFKRRVYA